MDSHPLGEFKSLYEEMDCHKELFAFSFSSLRVEEAAPSMFPANFCQLSEHVEKVDCGLGRQV